MKKSLTRALALVLIIFTLVSMVACSGSNTPAGTPDTNNGNTDNGNTDNGGNTGNTDNNGNTNDNGNAGNNGGNDVVVDTREEVDFDTLVGALKGSKYSSNIKTSDFVGLIDPSLVGINEATVNDVLYPIPADSECSHVINVKDYGVTPETTDCSAGLKDAIKAVKGKDGIKKIVFPEGDYKFAKTIIIDGLEDVYFCSEGNDKRFSITMTNWTPGIKVNNCTNIHFNNYDFDYAVPSAVTGVIVSSTENSVVIKVDEGYDLTHKSYNGAGFPSSRNGCYLEYVIDEETGRYVPNRNGNFFLSVNGRHDIVGGTYDADKNQMTLSFDKGKGMKPVEAGVKVTWAYTYYEYAAFEAISSKNLYLESVNIYHAMGMAMGVNQVENTYLNRVQETVRNGRLLMGTADGFHASSCKGEMVITNSVFEYSHDDAFNIKGWYGKVVANTPKSVSYDTSKEIDVEVGDVLDFYSTATFEYLGSYTVKKIDKAKAKYDFVESINVDLTGAYIANDTQINSFTMKNTYVGNKRCRGMLIQCRDVLIEGCTFQNVINGTMLIHSVADVFAEGIVPRNVVIRNNKFLDNYDCDIYVYTDGSDGEVAGTITGMEVSNNFFWSNENEPGYDGWWYGSGSKICYKSAGDSKITNNFFYYFNKRAKVVDIRLSENITVSDNYALGTVTNDDFKFVAVKESNTTNIVQNNNVLDIIN